VPVQTPKSREDRALVASKWRSYLVLTLIFALISVLAGPEYIPDLAGYGPDYIKKDLGLLLLPVVWGCWLFFEARQLSERSVGYVALTVAVYSIVRLLKYLSALGMIG
jgi:hypothetical protein